MRVFHSSKMAVRRFVMCYTISLLFMFGTICIATAEVAIYEIEPLAGMESSRAYGINENGKVCAKSYTTDDDDVVMTWEQPGINLRYWWRITAVVG